MARIPGISPHTPHKTIFPPNTRVPAAQRLRHLFGDEVVPPSTASAIELFERLWIFHEAAHLDHLLRKSTQVRRLGATRGPPLKAVPPFIPFSGLSLQQLFLHKLVWPEAWTFDPSVGRSSARMLKGAMKMRRAIYDFIEDGRFPQERAVVKSLEARLGQTLPAPIDREVRGLNLSLSASERFEAVEHYYVLKRKSGASSTSAVTPFIDRHIISRARASYEACRALAHVEEELANPKYFTAADLDKLENRYHVSALPPFAALKAVNSRTARLAICIEAALQVRPNSSILSLDLVLAAQVARKFNAFLLAKTGPRKYSRNNDVKIKAYAKLL